MKAIAENRPTHMSESTRIVLNYSFLISITYVLIFALAKIFNLEMHIEIRFVNYLLSFLITYSAIKKIYNLNGQKIEYLPGLSRAFLVSMLGSLWYCILFFIYLHIDKEFTSHLINQFNSRLLYPNLSITVVLFSEGFAISTIVALALMQFFKRKRGRWARM